MNCADNQKEKTNTIIILHKNKFLIMWKLDLTLRKVFSIKKTFQKYWNFQNENNTKWNIYLKSFKIAKFLFKKKLLICVKRRKEFIYYGVNY